VPQEDVTAALEMIRRHQPTVVVLEEAFALSARAAALVTRLETDPDFHGVEIRVLTAEAVAALNSPHAAHKYAQVSLATLAKPLPRRAARVRPTRPVEILIDGNPATLVNLNISTGVLVLSIASAATRPCQRSTAARSGRTGSSSGPCFKWRLRQRARQNQADDGSPVALEEILSRLALR
jgi:hypothetical protein